MCFYIFTTRFECSALVSSVVLGADASYEMFENPDGDLSDLAIKLGKDVSLHSFRVYFTSSSLVSSVFLHLLRSFRV